MNWQDKARALTTGSKIKVQCCGNSPSALISNDRKGIRYHCFRCTDFNGFEPHGRRTVSEILAAKKAVSEIKSARVIPDRCLPLHDPDVIMEAYIWVLKAGLKPEDAYNLYGMKYDPFLRRVIIPLENGFLSRALFSGSPKYIKSSTSEIYELNKYDSDKVVITEDILSAIKVHKAGYNALAILGTAVSITIANKISKYKKVVVWTDDDKAGKNAFIKLKRKLSLYPLEVKRILTVSDPKLLHINQIQQEVEKIK